jgi:shikimate kinase
MNVHNSCKREKPDLRPQKILVIGTLGAGKTTLAESLARDTGFPYDSIDDCRIRYGDGTVSGEESAWDHFLEVCGRSEPGILEFSGGGPHVDEVRKSLLCSTIPVSVIWLVLPLDTCITRALGRQKNIPAPFQWAPVEHFVPAIHYSIESAWDSIWSREPGFRATRQVFPGTTSGDEIYSVIRQICSAVNE